MKLYKYLIGGKKTGKSKYNYFPKTKDELKALVIKLIEERGNNADLNDIDTSEVVSMCALFKGMKEFNGDISRWDTGNVEDMSFMFCKAENFNGDISRWETGKVTNMDYMFNEAKKFNQDISEWDTGRVTDMWRMFDDCPIKDKNKPVFGK